MPSARHVSYQALPGDQRRAVLLLVPLLRLADSLDRSHEQNIDGLECRIQNGAVTLLVRSEADTDLEMWAAERVSEIFREVYGGSLYLERQ